MRLRWYKLMLLHSASVRAAPSSKVYLAAVKSVTCIPKLLCEAAQRQALARTGSSQAHIGTSARCQCLTQAPVLDGALVGWGCKVSVQSARDPVAAAGGINIF